MGEMAVWGMTLIHLSTPRWAEVLSHLALDEVRTVLCAGLAAPVCVGRDVWVLCVHNKGMTVLTVSIDPFKQESQSTPKTLASGEHSFFIGWTDSVACLSGDMII
jgi:hypothetical protein